MESSGQLEQARFLGIQQSESLSVFRYWLIVRRRWLPALVIFLIIFSLNFLNVLRKPNIYRAEGALVYKSENDSNDLIGLEGLTQVSSKASKDIQTEVGVISSTPILREVVAQLDLDSFDSGNSLTSKFTVKTLKRNLSLRINKDSEIIKFSFDHGSPELAKQVVNTLMQRFLQRNIKNNRADSVAARQFITQQIPVVRANVLRMSNALRHFQEKYGLVSFNAEAQLAENAFSNIQAELHAVDSELAGLKSQYTSLQQQLEITSSADALEASDRSQSDEILQISVALGKVNEQLAVQEALLNDSHPLVIDLRNQQSELQKRLSQLGGVAAVTKNGSSGAIVGNTREALLSQLINVELLLQSAIDKRKVLLNQQSKFKLELDKLPEVQHQYRELERELRIAESTYNTLLQRLQETKVAENQTIPTVEIFEPAELPERPILPNRISEIFRGMISALLLAAGVAYLLEILDRKIKNLEEIKSAYPFPILGSISTFKFDKKSEYPNLPLIGQIQSPMSETYKMLQANLDFLQSDHPVRLVSVSSSVPKEGKSISSAHLAYTLSENKRVILIDCDLRKPTQHRLWEIPNRYGISNVLTDDQSDFTHVFEHIYSVSDTLSILPTGMLPPNPLGLIDSKKMQDFILWLKQFYDYIVVDLPPLSVAADALYMSKMTDGLLLVARPGILDKGAASHCSETLQQSKVNVLGVLANGLIRGNELYGSYGSYYSSYYHGGYYSKNQEPLEQAQ